MHQRFSIFTFIRKILNSLQVIILIVKILVQRSSQSVKYKKLKRWNRIRLPCFEGKSIKFTVTLASKTFLIQVSILVKILYKSETNCCLLLNEQDLVNTTRLRNLICRFVPTSMERIFSIQACIATFFLSA